MAKQYKTLAELKAAFDSGELKREDCMMILDNDCTPTYDRGEWDEETEDWTKDDLIFNSHGPSCLLEEALTLLNIPWENA